MPDMLAWLYDLPDATSACRRAQEAGVTVRRAESWERSLLRALEAMQAAGYAYAVIGDVGPVEFYEKVCGAFLIPGS